MRGHKNYLFDENGKCYLDFYNNVPHVGHSHPRIAKLVYNQLKLVNSNTRYLHPIQKTKFYLKIYYLDFQKNLVMFFLLILVLRLTN